MRPALPIFFAMLLAAGNAQGAGPVTDSEIRKRLVAESLNAYLGNCPCPESMDAAGRRCGARAAYLRAGGRAPLCYPDDVTDEQVRRYRDSH